MTVERALRPALTAAGNAARAGGAGLPRRSAIKVASLATVAAIVTQPLLHPTGPGNSSPVDLLILASIATAAIWAGSSHQKLRAPYVVPVAVMIAAGAASGLQGALPTLSLMTLAIDVLLFAWCTTLAGVLDNPRCMRWALVAWSWSAIAWAGVVVLGWLGHVGPLEGLQAADGNRVTFTFGDPNYASAYWDVSMFVVYATRCPTARWVRIIGYLLLLWALALTESNGGVLALLAGIAFLVLIRAYRWRGWVGVAATAITVALVVGGFFTVFPLNTIRQWAAISGQSFLVNSIGRSAQSSSERGLLASEIKQLYTQGDGFLGLGPASTKQTLATELYPYANEAHNDFLAAIVERGTIGLLGLVLLVGAAASRAGPIIRRPRTGRFAAAVPHPVGLVAGLLTLAVNSLYEEVLHFRFLWALLAIVAVLGAEARRTRW